MLNTKEKKEVTIPVLSMMEYSLSSFWKHPFGFGEKRSVCVCDGAGVRGALERDEFPDPLLWNLNNVLSYCAAEECN